MEKETGVSESEPGIYLRWGGIATLRRVILVIGVAVFFFSIIFPFLEYTFFHRYEDIRVPSAQVTERSAYQFKFKLWSFKCFCSRIGSHSYSTFEKWFFDYWFHFLEFSKIILPLFVIQIGTLLTAITCIFTKRRIFNVLPAILCPASTVLMIYTFVYLSEFKWVSWVSYCQGYWITYFAEAIFLINLILSSRKTRTYNE